MLSCIIIAKKTSTTLYGYAEPLREAEVAPFTIIDVYLDCACAMFKLGPSAICSASTAKSLVQLKPCFIFICENCITLKKGSGPHLEVLQYQGNPWDGRSKLHSSSRSAKIELIAWGAMPPLELLNSKEQLFLLDLSQKAEKR